MKNKLQTLVDFLRRPFQMFRDASRRLINLLVMVSLAALRDPRAPWTHKVLAFLGLCLGTSQVLQQEGLGTISTFVHVFSWAVKLLAVLFGLTIPLIIGFPLTIILIVGMVVFSFRIVPRAVARYEDLESDE